MTRAHFTGWGIFWVFSGLVIAAACAGGDERPPTNSEPPTINAASSATNGSGGSGGEDGSSETSSTDSGGTSAGGTGGGEGKGAPPVVELLSPEDEDEPDEVYDTSLDVSCQVTQSEEDGATPVDPSTVVIELFKDDELIDTRPGVESDDADVYETTFPVQNIESGALTVRCSAADTATMPVTGSTEVQTFLDHGPLVEVLAPLPGSAESPVGAVVFEYEVLPDELVSNDGGAAIEMVELTVKGEDFEIAQLADDEDIYHTTIDFSDPTIFAEVPQGSVSVALTATNARGVAYVERYDFILDGRGPKVTIESPDSGDVVGGTVSLVMNVTDDASGVNLDTLEVELNDKTYPYNPSGTWSVDGDRVVFQFESGSVEGTIVQINVNVAVEDNAGNESPGASTLLYRDEQPPIISLDPPNVRAWDISSGECSTSFDPVGTLAANHGDRVNSLHIYRALVWDKTNDAGGSVLHYAWTDKNSVQLFARTPDQPLVVDTTGDGVCDDIYTDPSDPSDDDNARYQVLTAMSETGSAWFSAQAAEGTDIPAFAESGCIAGSSSEPRRLCDLLSDLTTVIHHSNVPSEPVVYSIGPTSSGAECTGKEWELPSVVPGYEGWVCLAVRALDTVGNRGISKPIAVCLDNLSVDGEPSCTSDLNEEPPDCRGDCDDPPIFDPGGFFYYE